MKNFIKIALVVALACSSSAVLAFHDGGVAECAGCHTMHNSQDGANVTDNATGYNYLLIAGNATDTCLSCHAGYGQFYGGEGYGPGGDFYWITRTYTWTAHGHEASSTGDSHGHNVISPAHGIAQDATLASAPGGDFLSQYLGCTSCHDPHGNQNFRLLYGSTVGPKYDGGRYDFDADAPEAKGNSRRTMVGGGGNETNARHTVYKSGMTEWCGNCHPNFMSQETSNHVHPVGVDMGSTVADVYNAYISTDEIVGGSEATSYWGLVPFEAVNADLESVDSTNYTLGPQGTDQVMCLTCHRAHASAFSDAGRWDFAETFIADSRPDGSEDGATPEDVANKYYEYSFVQNQRSLCNKCHIKDQFDADY
ncbi:MAG: cytochrome c3 family protein [Candidatus Krumholzibacteriia bacterium]